MVCRRKIERSMFSGNRSRFWRKGFLLLAFVGLVSSCAFFPLAEHPGSDRWIFPTLVTFRCTEVSIGMNQDVLSWISQSDDHGRLRVLAREGDLVLLESDGKVEMLFPYNHVDGPEPEILRDDFRIRVGDMLIALDLSSASFDPEWVLQAEERALAKIRLCWMDDSSLPTDPASERAIRKLARVCPKTGWIVKHPKDLNVILPLFTPERIWILEDEPMSKETWKRICQTKTLRYLAVHSGNFAGLDELDPADALYHLSLWEWDSSASRFSENGWDSLRSLTLMDASVKTLECIEPFQGLREIHLRDCEELRDIQTLSQFPGLRAVSFQGSPELVDVSPLVRAGGLEWVGFPENTTQAQFSEVIENNQGIRYLELIRCKNVKDLLPAEGLPALEYLVILSEEGVRPALSEWPGLRLLALPEETFEDAGYIHQLRNENPDCTVIRAAPYCMGSGWILLLWLSIPGWMLLRRVTRRG